MHLRPLDRALLATLIVILAAAGCGSSHTSHPQPDLLMMSTMDMIPTPPVDMSVPPPEDAAADMTAQDMTQPPAADLFTLDLFRVDMTPAIPPDIYISTTGSDTAPGDGTAAHPFLTLSKATSVAVSGQTIIAAAGAYPVSAVNIRDGVGVQAATSGTVTFNGSSTGLTFLGSGTLQGVILSSAAVNASTGTVNLIGVQFTHFTAQASGFTAINTTSTAQVVLTPAGVANYIISPCQTFAFANGSSKIEIHGGAINGGGPNGFSGDAMFNINGTSQLVLDGVTMDGGSVGAILAQGTSNILLENSTLIHGYVSDNSPFAISLSSSPTVVIDHSTLSVSPSPGTWTAILGGSATATVTLQNGALIDATKGNASPTSGISLGGASTLTIDNSRVINANGNGIFASAPLTLVTKAGAVVSGHAGNGLYLQAGGSVTMRGTEVVNNTQNGVYGQLSATSMIDLGTALAAGGNTFTGSAATAGYANVNFFTAAGTTGTVTVNAIGNTWDTGQGFPSPSPFSAPPNVAGKNVQLTTPGGGTVKLIAAP